MISVRKLKKAAGLIAAPIAYNLSWLTNSAKLAEATLRWDPHYFRAYHYKDIPAKTRIEISRLQQASHMMACASEGAVETISDLLSHSEAQFLQDIFCAIVLDCKRSGFFVEAGVGSGKTISNTYMFEKYLGWDGLLMEPNRSLHDSISSCRDVRLDRRAAASQSGKVITFEEYPDMQELSRLAGAKSHNMGNAKVKTYEVETVTLNDVLAEINAPKEIDLVSIDTEGSEVDILKGFDLSKYRVNVMVLEHNNDPKVQAAFDNILTPHGYRRVLKEVSGVDAWYVHRSVSLAAFPGA